MGEKKRLMKANQNVKLQTPPTPNKRAVKYATVRDATCNFAASKNTRPLTTRPSAPDVLCRDGNL